MTVDLELFRQRKDEFFGSDPTSPLTPEQQTAFTGLRYYPENPALRFEVAIEPFAERVEVQLQTNSGEARPFIRYGRFHIELEGQPVDLTVYTPPGGLGSLFVPFTDATTGDETYGAGRYLDLTPVSGGVFMADFNLAYNPYCAYNDRWTCPVPPPENRLSVPIRAGEMTFSK